ncbi:hypothetical protein RFI_00183, partial [Reticulomyxa filosa]
MPAFTRNVQKLRTAKQEEKKKKKKYLQVAITNNDRNNNVTGLAWSYDGKELVATYSHRDIALFDLYSSRTCANFNNCEALIKKNEQSTTASTSLLQNESALELIGILGESTTTTDESTDEHDNNDDDGHHRESESEEKSSARGLQKKQQDKKASRTNQIT